MHGSDTTRRDFLSRMGGSAGLLLGLADAAANPRRRPARSGGRYAAHRTGAVRDRAGAHDPHGRLQRDGPRPAGSFSRGRDRNGGYLQRHRRHGVCPLARLRRADHSGRRGGGEQPRGAAAWTASLPDGSRALGLPVRAHPRDVDGGPEPRYVHRSVWVCAYRAEAQPGAVRPGDLSGDARMGSLPDHHGGTGRQ